MTERKTCNLELPQEFNGLCYHPHIAELENSVPQNRLSPDFQALSKALSDSGRDEALETCGSMLTNPSPIWIHRLLFGKKVFRYSKIILDLACVDHDFPCPFKPARNCGANDWISYCWLSIPIYPCYPSEIDACNLTEWSFWLVEIALLLSHFSVDHHVPNGNVFEFVSVSNIRHTKINQIHCLRFRSLCP